MSDYTRSAEEVLTLKAIARLREERMEKLKKSYNFDHIKKKLIKLDKKDKRTWQKKNIVKYVDATKTSVLVMNFVNLVVVK